MDVGLIAHEEHDRIFWDPRTTDDPDRWHAVAAELRRTTPALRVETAHHRPFLALTRHADVLHVERHSDRYLNTERSVLSSDAQHEAHGRQQASLKTLIHMDGDEHRKHRAVTSGWFKTSAVRSLESSVTALAETAVDRMAALGGRCDFVADVALHFPLEVIVSILGLPTADASRMLQLTQELFGSGDPAVRRAGTDADVGEVLLDFRRYFAELADARRAHPTSDLASVIANAVVDGAPIEELVALSYFVLIATAGHDTTSATLAGGLAALIDRPDQLAALRADPALIPNAVDEMVRWVSPVRHFMRHAVADDELGGVTIRPGDALMLSYPSANRDEDVFDDPFRFDVARPNADRHLGFGFGAHFCLGAHLARLELRAFFTALLPRLQWIERDGPEAHTRAVFVGGLRSLPIHFELV